MISDEEIREAIQMDRERIEAGLCWIPVSERLPDESGCCLEVIESETGRRVSFGYFFGPHPYSKLASTWDDDDYDDERVTHWMPLPPLPPACDAYTDDTQALKAAVDKINAGVNPA